MLTRAGSGLDLDLKLKTVRYYQGESARFCAHRFAKAITPQLVF